MAADSVPVVYLGAWARPFGIIGSVSIRDRVNPAMAAGLSETIMDWTDIVEAMDADAPAKKRGPYKKSSASGAVIIGT